MSSTTLFRVSGIVLIIASVLTVVSNIGITLLFPDSGPTVPPSDVLSPLWNPTWLIGFVGGTLLLFGLAGLYLRLAQKAGIVGLLGFLLTFLGVLFEFIITFSFAFSVLPYLAPKGSKAIADVFSLVAPFGLGGSLLFFIGTILLGIATMRTKIFPRLTGILILVGGILTPAAALAFNLVVSLIGTLSILLLCLGFAWIGMILTQQRSVVEAEVPSAAQAALR